MSTKINKLALPGIPGSDWAICQYYEAIIAPTVGSIPLYPGVVASKGNNLYISGYFGENTNVLTWTVITLQ